MGNYTQLYIHLVWATRFRQPLLTPVARDIAFRTFRAECRSLGATLIATGGVEDHVHLLVRIPTTVPIMTLVKQLKGVSSRRITLETGAPFRWQGGYGVFTVRKSGVDQVRGYILGQERRHARQQRRAISVATEGPPRTRPMR